MYGIHIKTFVAPEETAWSVYDQLELKSVRVQWEKCELTQISVADCDLSLGPVAYIKVIA